MPARERAYHELKYRILEGRLPPGTKLLESEVANLLAMSRTPIREALIKLEEERLVEVRPRHGITILRQSLDDLADIYEVFSTLEVRAARLAAQQEIDGGRFQRLEAVIEQMERATAKGDIEQWSHLDDVFHADIVELCGNTRLQATLRSYWDEQYRARMAIVRLRPLPTQSDREHREILQAIREQDADRAELLHRRHRERADEQALRLLREQFAAGEGRDGGTR
jgi:DNA-binding GntR family transcriptional regulator